MSLSVMIPTRAPFFTTGNPPILRRRMMAAASSSGVSGLAVSGDGVITS
jgi:hypothetical protein